jgi:hypothetical protein
MREPTSESPGSERGPLLSLTCPLSPHQALSVLGQFWLDTDNILGVGLGIGRLRAWLESAGACHNPAGTTDLTVVAIL